MNDSKGYWAATLSLLSKILVVWFLASYGAGICLHLHSIPFSSAVTRWDSFLLNKEPFGFSWH